MNVENGGVLKNHKTQVPGGLIIARPLKLNGALLLSIKPFGKQQGTLEIALTSRNWTSSADKRNLALRQSNEGLFGCLRMTLCCECRQSYHKSCEYYPAKCAWRPKRKRRTRRSDRSSSLQEVAMGIPHSVL